MRVLHPLEMLELDELSADDLAVVLAFHNFSLPCFVCNPPQQLLDECTDLLAPKAWCAKCKRMTHGFGINLGT